MKFKLTLEHSITKEKIVSIYDTSTSMLVDINNKNIDLSHLNIREPQQNNIKKIAIQLGYSCNMSCNYCLQSKTKKDMVDYKKIDELLEEMKKENLERCKIEFWGGEPLLYIDEIKYIVEKLNEISPYLMYSIITNGTLLTLEIAEFLMKNFFNISISHDAQAQPNRGKDPLEMERSLEAIRFMIDNDYKRLFFNSVISNKNINTKERLEYFQSKLDRIIPDMINGGEGIVYNTKLDLVDLSSLKNNVYDDILNSDGNKKYIPNVIKINSFLQTIKYGKTIETITTKCGIDKPSYEVISTNGKKLTCHNFDKPFEIKLFSDGAKCSSCIVAHLCRGGCPAIDKDSELFKMNCIAFYNYNIPIFKYTIEKIFTDYKLIKIDDKDIL